MGDWLLAVHSGAGQYGSSNEAAYLSLLQSALRSTHERITNSRCPPSAAQMAVYLLHSFEHSRFTNAGLGANLTENGHVECEASVVCGRTGFVACCGAVRGVKEPSALALKLLEQAERAGDHNLSGQFVFGRQPPLVVVGEHTRRLARDFGLETACDDAEELRMYQVTPKSRAHWNKWHQRFLEADTSKKSDTKEEEKDDGEHLDTVGSVCMDSKGNVAAALSSGGVLYKVPGRLGLAGCPRMGCDAANADMVWKKTRKRKRRERTNVRNAFAVACTGRGEHFFQSNFVSSLSRRLSKSANLDRALRMTFTDASNSDGRVGIEGGVLALVSLPREREDDVTARRVHLGAAFTTRCMGVGYLQCRANTEPEVRVQLLRRPETQKSAAGSVHLEVAVHVSSFDLVQHHPDTHHVETIAMEIDADGHSSALFSAVLRSEVQCEHIGPDALFPPLVEFMKENLASYRVPRKCFFVDEIPKNAMGKVNKKALSTIYLEKS
uniref:Uncharacterized protein n=1 Tax=Peronospora matthiolae TaxID=2874970 RepID=A0AAV1TJ06_9STRA